MEPNKVTRLKCLPVGLGIVMFLLFDFRDSIVGSGTGIGLLYIGTVSGGEHTLLASMIRLGLSHRLHSPTLSVYNVLYNDTASEFILFL